MPVDIHILSRQDQRVTNILQKIATERKLSTMLDTELEIIQKEFAGLDKDGDGDVTVEELRSILQAMRLKLKITDFQINKVISQLDKDGDGTIDTGELMEALKKFDTDGVIYKALHYRSTIRQDFQKYDEDGSGFISKDELVAIIKDRTGIDIPQKHIERLMKDSDENDDNQINYEEFVTLMSKSSMQRRVF